MPLKKNDHQLQARLTLKKNQNMHRILSTSMKYIHKNKLIGKKKLKSNILNLKQKYLLLSKMC